MWQEIMKETGMYICTTKNQAIKKEICLKMSLFCTLCSLLKSSLYLDTGHFFHTSPIQCLI